VEQLIQTEDVLSTGQPGPRSQSPPRVISMVSLYETIASMACSCFRVASPLPFPYGGTPTDSPASSGLPRCDLMVEIFKVIYVLRARSFLTPDEKYAPPDLKAIRSLHSLTPTPAVALPLPLVDYHLHMLIVELLLLPPTHAASHRGIYDCQLHALQLLSAVPPHPEVFSRVLEVVYQRSLTAPALPLPLSDKSSTTSLCAAEATAADATVDGNTVLALHLVTPMIISLLRILKLQLLAAEEISTRVTGGGDNERIAALLIPILVSARNNPHNTSLYFKSPSFLVCDYVIFESF
jgi:hypothetical protein